MPTAARSSSARKLPVVPCVCVGLGLMLFGVTVCSSILPGADDEAVAFAGAPGRRPKRSRTRVEAKKFTARDRGSRELEDYMKERGKYRAAAWEAMENQGWENVGVSNDDVRRRLEANEKKANAGGGGGGGGGGGFQMPSFEMPSFSSAPAEKPFVTKMNSVPSPAPAGAPAPGPFDWLVQIFQPTTTTTTTTPPPDPISAFFKNLR